MTARTAFQRIALLAVGAVVALATPLAAEAGQNKSEVAVPRVSVPHVPTPGGGISGCWSAQRPIYGPYYFSFCSNGQHGSYRVRGGGLSCEGGVTVTPGRGSGVVVRLNHSRCNGRTDWSADYLVCRAPGVSAGWSGQTGYEARPEVAVPRYPAPGYRAPRVPAAGGRLDCTYYPVVAGYHPIGLALLRN